MYLMSLMQMLFDQAGMCRLRLIPLGKILHFGLMIPLTQPPLLLVGKVGKVVGWGMAWALLSALFPMHAPFTLTTAFSHKENPKKLSGFNWPSKFRGRLGH